MNGVKGLAARGALVLTMLATLLAGLPPPPAGAAPVNLRWGYYITYDSTSLTSLRQHVGQLDIVSPYFYTLNGDGTIKDFSDPAALTVMRNAGVSIVPMIKNDSRWDDFHTTIATPDKRDAIVTRISDLVAKNGYNGIHIDFEAVNASDAALLTDFMQRLAATLRPQGKLVTQAVAARVSDGPSEWGGAYDYKALAATNDYIVVMAYDQHYAGGSPGPVAAVDWVGRVVSYARSRIPAANILLGVPFYGYNWDTTGGPPATSVRYDQTSALLARPGVQVGFDTTAQSPWLRYKDDAGHAHEVWYENADSLHAKLGVMLDNGLGGFAGWRLGHEDPAVWNEIAQLNTPATRIPAFPSSKDRDYFAATGHSLAYGFKSFWNQSGGLPVFGYPLTEEFTENGYTVQYFERQRFEYHPEYRGTPYEVLLGLLGSEDAANRGLRGRPAFQPAASQAGSPGCIYFVETGHNACGRFAAYWQSHGLEFSDPGISYRESLALFGYPISEPFTDPATGLTVQYFERARFEYHPENTGTQYDVLLGLLGADSVRAKGWIR